MWKSIREKVLQIRNYLWPARDIQPYSPGRKVGSCDKPDGSPYLTVYEDGNMINIQLHTYYNVYVKLDKKIAPQLINCLKKL